MKASERLAKAKGWLRIGKGKDEHVEGRYFTYTCNALQHGFFFVKHIDEEDREIWEVVEHQKAEYAAADRACQHIRKTLGQYSTFGNWSTANGKPFTIHGGEEEQAARFAWVDEMIAELAALGD